jgi:hypothetical protein
VRRRDPAALRPAAVCGALLAALAASEGRSRKRKRDQTPDRIGLGIKRAMLEQAVRDDPAPDAFEAWLLERCLDGGPEAPGGARRAMAEEILRDWRQAQSAPGFREWLARGAPSDDASPEDRSRAAERPRREDAPGADPGRDPEPRRARGIAPGPGQPASGAP